MKSINERKDEINPKFLSGLEKFKSLIRTTLSLLNTASMMENLSLAKVWR